MKHEITYCQVAELSENLSEIFNKISKNEIYSLTHIFQYLARESSQNSDKSIKNSLELLAKICSLMLDNKNKNNPFVPYMTWGNKYSFIPTNLSEEEMIYLSEIVDGVQQAVLKARIGDILWTYAKIYPELPRNVQYAYIAIDNYLLLDITQDFNLDIYDYWHRGVYLAKSIKDSNRIKNAREKLLNELNNNSTNWQFHQLRIAEIFLNTDIDESIYAQIADILFKKQQQFAISDSFNEKEQYLSCLIDLFKKSQNLAKSYECIHLLAKSYEEYGDFGKDDSNITANIFYKKALQMYRKILKEHREQFNITTALKNIERKITQSENLIGNELQLLSTAPKDISKLQQQSMNHVKDKATLLETLLYFSGVASPISYENMIKETKKNLTSSVASIFGSISISDDGRTIEKIPALNSDNKKEVIFKTAIKNFPIRMQIAVQGSIIPALQQIWQEHVIPKDFLIDLCKHATIVPDKREILMANALFYGFEGDFSTAIHLLAPQVENIVRQLFKNRGITTTHTDINDIEDEIGLSSLLDKPEAQEILGDDLWFELQAVFTNPLSANLRNKVAHGLLDDETSNSIYSVYAWWMILRLIIRNAYSLN